MIRLRSVFRVGNNRRTVAIAITVCLMNLAGGAWAPLTCDADEDVPLRTGLELWLDAARINVLREAAGQEFRGLFATNARGRRDYESGLTIDLGPGPTQSFDQLNIEGSGFGGNRA